MSEVVILILAPVFMGLVWWYQDKKKKEKKLLDRIYTLENNINYLNNKINNEGRKNEQK